ncbi:biotin-independent malonate decarboxylase subunit beta [Limnobacter sp.]|uniref:biotin-independent malonate decarboxylase subunit beta n=1 Tax=Limnobacter sp. TaxID=2003368 RepID=UPI0035141D1A
MANSYLEASARERVLGLLDAGSFEEILKPAERVSSPHMALLEQPVAFDDGVIIGRATLDGANVLVAAQEGQFLGGAIGEVHGAKITALIELALREKPAAVVLLFESGGVRLHEANAGLIAVSEIMRAVCAARAKGVQFIGAIGGAAGCFGGTGLIARCCDVLIMSEEGRLAMSGPEVIETVHGVEEFDSRDRALVWRVSGGKHRHVMGDVQALVADDLQAFRQALTHALQTNAARFDLKSLEAEHAMLQHRLNHFGDCRDAKDIWQRLGLPSAEALALMPADEFVSTTARAREQARGQA